MELTNALRKRGFLLENVVENDLKAFIDVEKMSRIFLQILSTKNFTVPISKN
ncbi:MAG: hypothetical protein KHZ72_01795 [Lachnospiraceae bacterium]|nr:hypothetical protein [Lachnospiraceae bacterium]